MGCFIATTTFVAIEELLELSGVHRIDAANPDRR